MTSNAIYSFHFCSEHCDVRIYIDGILPEHCVLTVGKQGNAFLEPLYPSALIFVNYVRITQKIRLNDNDVITVLKKDFRFAYPYNNLFSKICVMERKLSALPDTKRVQSIQKFRVNPVIRNRKKITSQLIESTMSGEFHTSKLLHSVRNSVPNNILQYVTKSVCHRFIPEKRIIKKYNSLHFNKLLIRHSNHYSIGSIDIERSLSLKLYQPFKFLKRMFEIYNLDRVAFMQIFQFICKYCITNVNEVVLTQSSPDVPFKLFNPKQDFRTKSVSPKKIMHTETFHEVLKNASTCSDSNLEVINQNGMPYNSKNDCEYFSSADFNKDKHNWSFKDTLTSYKKRVSLAVKRYNLRKKKSTAILKCSKSNSPEEFELFDKEPEQETGKLNDCSKACGVILQQNEQNFTNKKKRKPRKKTDSKDRQETTAKLMGACAKEQIQDLSPNKLKTPRKKRNYSKKNNASISKEEAFIVPLQKDCDRKEIPSKFMDDCADGCVSKEYVKNLSVNEFKTTRKKRNYKKNGNNASANKEKASIVPLQKDYKACEVQDLLLNEFKAPRKKRKNKKSSNTLVDKEEASPQKDSSKCFPQTEKLNLLHSQRITRSMARSKSALSN
ncbi:FHA domain-containing protein [Trichonephila clavata]|uniref:FHA domain-containing protein n=1 Tax=Trichonephila clavata TaxID=2740835 RepID=A0A8X6KQH3_TRICU|nr:FHA domain-containing protein [Trichonephila clavata]